MKKTYLLVAAVVLLLVGLVCLTAPAKYAVSLGIKLNDRNLLHLIRTFGGLFIGFSAFLLNARMQDKWLDAGVNAVILVMIGLIIGRGASISLDGVPDPKLLIGLALEIILAIWGIVILKRSK